jgi:hypothetical protein
MSKGAVCFNETAIEYYTPKSLVDMFGALVGRGKARSLLRSVALSYHQEKLKERYGE